MDPETTYAELTSGDAGVVEQVGADAQDLSRSVDADARAIVDAVSRPVWAGAAAKDSFETEGLVAYLAAAMAAFRLYRAGEVLEVVAADYRATCRSADHAIGIWRGRPGGPGAVLTDPLYEAVVLGALRVAESYWETSLLAGTAALQAVEAEIEEWVARGAVLDYVFYVDNDALPGPRIPDSGINGVPGGWTQQGLAYDPGTDRYYVSSYDEDGGAQVTTIDAGTGAPGASVPLAGPGGSAPPNHVGGIVVQGDQVLVTSTEGDHSYVYVYDRAAFEAGDGQPVNALDRIEAPASSYATIGPDGSLYLGDWDGNELHQVALVNGEYQTVESWNTPAGSNGVVVQPGGVFTFGVQTGRAERGQLVTVDSGGDGGNSQADLDGATTIDVGNMVQNLVVVDGRVVSITEAGATQYGPGDPGSTNPGALWGQTHLSELVNGGAGYDVEPRTLTEAAQALSAAQAGISDEVGRIAGLHLPSAVLGDVPGAPSFASGATAYLDLTSSRLLTSADSIDVSVTGLLAARTLYEETDSAAAAEALTIVERMV
ncbi:hypothetical protein [Nocardioides dongxiaopingii]|uniref:hypothetical protein n=1 Tax=Nocardioides dongxiaopingii TaxID=2576036 RepID=UPI0010C764E9|nr:hypothetical protein [Nocardioides dongxiaopingii]